MAEFDAPIPGQSLTTTPKNYPWERPPEMSNVNEVLDYYMSRLSEEDSIDNIIELLNLKTPVNTIVNATTKLGVMQGLHTVDVKLLVSPVLHEYIKTIGKRAGIEVEDEFDRELPSSEKESVVSLIHDAIDKIEMDEDETQDDAGVDLMRQTAKMLDEKEETEEALPSPETEPEVAAPPSPQMPQEKPQQGLMSRRGPM